MDENCRTQWQSIWSLLSPLAAKLVGLWSINHEPIRLPSDSDEDAIVGTLLNSNELSIFLNRRDFELDLESTNPYRLDLAISLVISAQSLRLSLRPTYVFPRPLSPIVVKDPVIGHRGSTDLIAAGLMLPPSTISSS